MYIIDSFGEKFEVWLKYIDHTGEEIFSFSEGIFDTFNQAEQYIRSVMA